MKDADSVIKLFKDKIANYHDHLVITDSNSVILYMNYAAEKHTGFSFEDAKGKKPSELWGGYMPKSYYEDMWRTIKEEKKPFVGEVKNARRNGEDYWQALDITPVLNSNNEPEFFIAIEMEFKNEKTAMMARNVGGVEFLEGISIKPFQWIVTWLEAHSVIKPMEEEEIITFFDKDTSAAEFVAKILSKI